MPRTKISADERLIFKDGKFVYERKEYTKTFDELERRWNRSKPIISYIQIEERGLVKTCKLKAIIRRSAFDSHLKPIYALFLQEFQFEIPNDKARKWHFLSYMKGHVFLHKLEFLMTQEISFNDVELCTRIGKEVKLTEQKAKKLLAEKSVHPYIMEEQGNILATTI